MKNQKSLSFMINNNEFIIAQGSYNALTAKMIESQEFNAVYMTGFGTAASIFGLLDRGLITLN